MASLVTTTVDGALTIDNGSHAYQYFNSGASAEAGFFLKHNGSNIWEIYKRSAATKDFAIYDFGSTNGGIKLQIPHDGTTMALMAGGGTVNCGGALTAAAGTFTGANTNAATYATFQRSDAAVSARIRYDGVSTILIGTSTNHPISFETNATPRLTISAAGAATFTGALTATAGTFSGKLTAFLNTTSSPLHTRGSNIIFDAANGGTNVNILARAYDETYWGQMEFTATQGWITTRTTGPLKLGANNAAAIYIVNGGKVGIGTTAPAYKLDVNGAARIVDGISSPAFWYRPSTTAVHCWQPKDGYYHTTTNAHTGAIRIKLPPFHDSMVTFWVDVYDYALNESFSAYISGYPYQGSTWSYTSAVIIGGVARNFTVRFGDNNTAGTGAEYYVYIGETNSTWAYPQVVVRDVFAGYSSNEWDGDDDGWDVTFVTSFANIAQTQSNTLPYGDYNKLLNTPTLSFLPLSGGTLTGALNGTTATFTGNITTNSTTHAYVVINSSATTTASWVYHKQGGNNRWLAGVEGSETRYQLYSNVTGSTGVKFALDTSGNGTFSGNVTLTTGGSDAAPRLAFGDGNTGFFELGDNDLYITIGGTRSFIIEENAFYGANATAAMMRGAIASAATTASFCFNSDTDTGIGRAAANKLSLVAGGVGTVTVTSSAVGIGTTAPTAALETVYSGGYGAGIQVRSTSGYAVLTMDAASGTYPILEFKENNVQKWQFFNEPADDSINFYSFVSAGTRMTILQDGKVGIGTAAPGSKLTVNQSGGAGEVSALSLIHSRTGTPANGDAVSIEMRGDFWTGSAANERVMASIRATVEDVTNGAPKGKLAFATLDTTGAITDKVTILSDGNVGIGTTAPTSWLQVLKDNNNSGNQFSVADSEGASAAVRTYTHGGDPEALILNHYYAVSGSGNEYMRYSDIVSNIGNGAGTTIRFITKNAANTYSTTVIDNNGKVGIGTAAPSEKLDVNGAILLRASGYTTYAAKLHARLDSTHCLSLESYLNSNTAFEVIGTYADSGGSNTRVVIAAGGQNVGIGTTAPAQKLHVVGNQKVTGYLDVGAGATLGQARIFSNATNLILQAQNNGAIEARLTNTNLAISNNVTSFILDATASSFAGFNSNSNVGTALLSTGASTRVALAPNGVEKVSVLASGNVGIGETAPAHKLSIGDTAAIHLGYNSTLANHEVGRITSNTYNVDNAAYSLAEMVLLTSSANGYTGSIQFRTNSVNSTNTRAAVRMTILSDGKVGIGTTNPGQLLEVGSSGDSEYALIGKTKVGGGMGHGDYAGFSHRSMGGTGNFALLQSAGGATYLNAASGSSIYFQNNNVTVLAMSGSGLTAGSNNVNTFGERCIFDLDYSTYNTYFKLTNASTYGLIAFRENTTHKGFFGIGGSSQTHSATTSSYSANGFTWNLDGAGHMIIANRGTSKMIRLCTGTEGNANFDTVRIENGAINLRGVTTVDTTLNIDGATVWNINYPVLDYNLSFRPDPGYAGIRFNKAGGTTGSAGYLLIKDNSDALPTYTANGITLVGDTGHVNIVQRTSSTHRIRFCTGASPVERLSIANDGKVGIGTTSPGAPLVVVGTGDNARIGSASDGVVIAHASGVGYLQGTDTGGSAYNALGFKTSANYALYIDTSDRVGIGTAAPEGKLNIYVGSAGSVTPYADSHLIIEANTDNSFMTFLSPAGKNQGILFGDGDANWRGQVQYNHNSDNMHFYTAAVEALRLDSSQGATFLGAATFSGSIIRSAANVDVAGIQLTSTTGTNGAGIRFRNTGGDYYLAVDNSAANRLMATGQSAAYALVAMSEGDYPFIVATNGTRRAIFNSTGLSVTGELSVSSTVKAAGKLVVGSTATPISKFQIHNTQSDTMTDAEAFLALRGNGGDGLLMGQRATSPYGAWIQAGYLPNIGTSHHYPLILQPHGSNVGIGTTAPAAQLEVYSTTANSNGIAYIRQAVATNNPTLLVEQTTSGGNANVNQGLVVKAVGTSDGSGNTLHVYRRDGSTTGLVVKGSGNVGIGTDSPSSLLEIGASSNTTDQLQINGPTSTTKLHIGQFSNGAYIFSNYRYRGGHSADSSSLGSAGIVISADSTSGVIAFDRAVPSATPSRTTSMVIANTGNVGIGTASPSSKFHIWDGTTVDAFKVENYNRGAIWNSVGAGGMYSEYQLTGTWKFRLGQANHLVSGASVNDFAFSYAGNLLFSTSVTERMRITDSGKVGIGTTAPARPLAIYNNSLACLQLCNSTTGAAAGDGFQMQLSGSTGYIFNYESGDIIFGTSSATRLTLKAAGQAVFTGDLTCSDDLYLNGTDAWIISGSAGSVNTGGILRLQGFGELEVDGVLDINGTGTSTFAGALSGTTATFSGDVDTSTVTGGTVYGGTSASNTARLVMNAGSLSGYYTENDPRFTLGRDAFGGGDVGLMLWGTAGIWRDYPSGDLKLRAGSSDRLTILSNGNVGIGTTAPAATLHVRDTTASTSRWTAAFVADNAAIVSAQAHDHVLIQSNDVPSLKLYEYGQDQVGGIAVGDNNCTIASTETLRFYVNGSATDNIYNGLAGTRALLLSTSGAATFVGSVTATTLTLSTGTITHGSTTILNSSRELMNIAELSINASTAGSNKLYCNGNANINGDCDASTFTGSGAALTSLNGSNISSGTVASARLGTGTASSTTYLAGNGTWSTPSGGGGGSGTVTSVSVGTGLDVSSATTTPNITLDFNELATAGTITGTDDLVVVDGTATRKEQVSTISLSAFSGYYGLINQIYKTAAGSSISPDSSGHVIMAEGTGVSLSYSGNTITFATGTSSDYRLKKNISNFNSNAWAKVKSVNLRKFDFDEDAFKIAIDSPDAEIVGVPKSYTDNVGFIAHELAEVGIEGSVIGEKDAVDADGNLLYQKINYIALVPALWGALNEAISKIETLESKVQALENK